MATTIANEQQRQHPVSELVDEFFENIGSTGVSLIMSDRIERSFLIIPTQFGLCF